MLTLAVLPLSTMAGDQDSLENLFGIGKISGQTGVNFRVDDADNKDLVDDGDKDDELDYKVYAGSISMRF